MDDLVLHKKHETSNSIDPPNVVQRPQVPHQVTLSRALHRSCGRLLLHWQTTSVVWARRQVDDLGQGIVPWKWVLAWASLVRCWGPLGPTWS